MVTGSRIQLGLPQLPSGLPDNLQNQFILVYNAINNLSRQLSEFAGIDEQPSDIWNQLTVDQTIWQINPGRFYVKQNEALTFGHCVSLVSVGAEIQARKANATNNTKPAYGFVTSTDHVSGAGLFCEVTLGIGLITGVLGLAPPQRYFLSTTDGVITNVAPAAAGNIVQVVGFALAGNRLLMNIPLIWTQL
jgi:hypothetical protein